MIPKQDLLELAKKEYATTLRMLRALPADQGSFKPHERSNDALRIAMTFVFEMYLCAGYLFHDSVDRSKFQNYKPENMEIAVKDFERESAAMITHLEALPEEDLKKTIDFGGKKFTGDKFALMMICDQIHHRGQFSVYVRMAGGKVPSIYGPSADDKETNL